MNVKLLIDAMVRQTTVLIAQLSTAAGVRAPLAHIADQVFLSLAREIEAQGVGRKVVADMFGLALRSYQKKTQRLSSSVTEQGKTLFEAVLEYLEKEQTATRSAVVERFRHDGERETIGVLTDLVGSGLIYVTGRGVNALYGVTSQAERQRLTRQVDEESLAEMVWGSVYRSPSVGREELLRELNCEEGALDAALLRLQADGRVAQVERAGEVTYSARTFQIPVGAERGWESAVFDHFQAVATSIANKLALLGNGSSASRIVGGTTLRFELSPTHPHRERVVGLLEQIRTLGNEVWNDVSDYNDAHPIPADERFNVCLYFGQSTDDPERALGDFSNGKDS